jgi:protein-S-isoprenylcysteine O-methyltransferase Ste14
VKFNYGSLALVAIAFVVLLGVAWGPPWTPMHVAGLVVAIPSFLLLALARIQLGRAFSVQAKATTLVTSGLYSRIRNPIYVFGGLFFFGIILFVQRPLLLLFFVVLIPMQILRVRNEERVLQEKFGGAFLDYKRRTWF